MNIKPIQTRYRGYHFRSRLEARWAVFFDALCVEWEYEPEGFVLPDGAHYLPDFRVRFADGRTAWFEVKPCGDGSDPKLRQMQDAVGSPSAEGDFFAGRRVCHVAFGMGTVLGTEGSGAHSRVQVQFDAHEYPKWLVIAFARWLHCESGDVAPVFETLRGDPYDYWARGKRLSGAGLYLDIRSAAEAARSARFEHGECGRT
jgi:hypothetical protein